MINPSRWSLVFFGLGGLFLGFEFLQIAMGAHWAPREWVGACGAVVIILASALKVKARQRTDPYYVPPNFLLIAASKLGYGARIPRAVRRTSSFRR